MAIKTGETFSIEEELVERDRVQNQFLMVQAEKNEYLGEYKERVIIALTKEQLIRNDIYPELIEVLQKDKDVYLLKMSRDVPLKKLKPYIMAAEKSRIKYSLVDGLSYVGNIGLVIVSKQELSEIKEEIIPETINQDFIDAGMENYMDHAGERLCLKCYKKIEENIPKHTGEFSTISVLDSIIGKRCPVCGKRGRYT